MSTPQRPPLAVHLIWHPSDSGEVSPILSSLQSRLSRDVYRPFSRTLNIPIFCYSTNTPSVAPTSRPDELAVKNVVIPFISRHTLGNPAWRGYLNGLIVGPGSSLVPVAIDDKCYGHASEQPMRGINFLRMHDWPHEGKTEHAIISIAHEILRHGLTDIRPEEKGTASSVCLFLSHAKYGGAGLAIAESIKKHLDKSNLKTFFDAKDISPGLSFADEIEKHIGDATLVAIGSDAYSASYWCQRELISAKKSERPAIAVNCLEDFEDRTLPASGNIPCVHIAQGKSPTNQDILRVLQAAILETLRFSYAKALLLYYKNAGWIEPHCVLSARPPEIRQVIKISRSQAPTPKAICYPEPPLYLEESEWIAELGVSSRTPLWSAECAEALAGFSVGMSISEFPADYQDHHIPQEQLVRLSQDAARHILARSGTLLYGGDLRPGGFTEYILDEAQILQSRLRRDIHPVKNYLAWPIHRNNAGADAVAWRAKYSPVLNVIETPLPSDALDGVDPTQFLPPSSPQNRLKWSRSLTEMRIRLISDSGARVCAGGKLKGYLGKMPGVIEEISIAITLGKPLYLLGAFGGATERACQAIVGGQPAELTEAWQITHNDGYADLQDEAERHTPNARADYPALIATLRSRSLSDLATIAGLSSDEYLRLMKSPFVDECVLLVLKGLAALQVKR